ncbi:MAG: hypothetical protein WC593_09720 [Methanoregula sp.]
MPRSILFILCLISLVTSVSGYGLYVDCTDRVIAGTPIKCSIDSDLPVGTIFFVELYSPTVQQIATQQVTIMEDKTTQYKIFDTTGLASGNYSVNARLRIDGTIFRNDSQFGNTVIITGVQIPPTTTTQTITITKSPLLSATITPTATPIITITRTVTPTATPIQTVIISTIPTKSVEELLNEQNKKIDEQNRLIAEQNKKIESQNDLLNQILSKIKSVFGWN